MKEMRDCAGQLGMTWQQQQQQRQRRKMRLIYVDDDTRVSLVAAVQLLPHVHRVQ